MPRRTLDRIRAVVRHAAYDMTAHAVEEMAETVYEVTEP